MPVTYTNSLRGTGFPQFRKSFLYVDDPAEDDAFVAFVRENLDQFSPNLKIRNLTIDRTGAPEFQWDTWSSQSGEWAQTGTASLPIGSVNEYWRTTNSSQGLGVAPFDMTNYWECDEYGRALDINSLVAP